LKWREAGNFPEQLMEPTGKGWIETLTQSGSSGILTPMFFKSAKNFSCLPTPDNIPNYSFFTALVEIASSILKTKGNAAARAVMKPMI
jgi:hypothetical protein